MILFFGDPHGEFRHIIREVQQQKPEAIILLGDIEAPLPLDLILKPIIDRTDIWFIHGNHDTDTQEYWSNLYGSKLSNKSLHGRVCVVDGRKVAGLGGVFRQSVWMPGKPSADIQNYNDYCAQSFLRHKPPVIAQNMKMKALSSIYPDDYYTVAMDKADILVTHEAPSCHQYGFGAIDELASSLGVQESVHGHHHDSLDYRSQWPQLGFRAYGVEYRGIKSL